MSFSSSSLLHAALHRQHRSLAHLSFSLLDSTVWVGHLVVLFELVLLFACGQKKVEAHVPISTYSHTFQLSCDVHRQRCAMGSNAWAAIPRAC